MSILRPATLAVITALGLLLVGAVSAPAHTSLRTDPQEQPLFGPTTITNTSSSHFTLQLQTGTVTCLNSTFTADVNANTGLQGVTGQLTSLTAVGCTDTLPAVTVVSCHLENRPVLHIFADISVGGTFLLTDPTLRCSLAGLAGACYYTSAIAPGSYNNVTSTLAYETVFTTPVAATPDALPSGPCGDSGRWSVTYTHIVQELTNRTLTVSPI